MSNLRKRITALLLLISMLFTEGSVFAAETLKYTHTSYQKVAYNRAYQYNTLYANTKLGNNTAYCVDYGRRNPSQGTNLPKVRNLSAKATNVLLNGYPYKTASQIGVSNNDEAYYATQLAFWMVAKQESKKNALTLRLSDLSPVAGKETFLNNAKAGAERIIAAANANPYKEAKPSLEINGSSAKVAHQNGKIVVGPYVVNGKNLVEGITVSLENAPASAKLNKTAVNAGESIYVEMNETEVGSTAYINVKSAGVKYEGNIYETTPNDMQDFAIIEQTRLDVSDRISFKWDTLRSKINVIKVDQNKDRIKGVIFELQKLDGTKVAEGTSNDNGVVEFNDVIPGKYKLVETKAPNGYIKGDKPLEFEVETGKPFTIKVENTKIAGRLKVIKTDNITKTPIAGVQFQIFNEAGQMVDTIVTDKNGEALSKDLALGKYTYKESKVPAGIVLDSTVRPFEITAHEQVITKNIVNRRIVGKLKIIKVDDMNQAPIAGVKFEILNNKKQVVDTILTDKNGEAITKELVYGEYSFREVSAPAGFVVNNKEYDFNITEDRKVIIKKVINARIKGKLRIEKVDSETKLPLSGVKFQILDSNKNVIETLTTNILGIAESKVLVNGKYFYKEIEALPGYMLDDEIYPFEITENGKVIRKVVENAKVYGKLKVIKTDNINKMPIKGVEFEIINSEGKVVETIVTNENGEAITRKLPLGKYTYKESKVPAGIVLDPTVRDLELNENGKVLIKKIVNRVITGRLQIVKVDDMNEAPIAGVKFEILDSNKKVIDTVVTNKDGLAMTKELVYGKYSFRETEAPEGYVLNDKEYDFDITEDKKLVVKKVVNEVVKGKLKIEKIDSETRKPLKGVKFEILDSKKNVIETIETNSNGIAESKVLVKGEYFYKEIETLPGYVIDDEPHKFSVIENNKLIERVVENSKMYGRLKVIKTDNIMKMPIANVEFEIFNKDGKLVDTIITDKNGEAMSGRLPKGKYTYRESKVPAGIVLDQTMRDFEITANEQVITKNIVNKKIVGKLQVIKTDDYVKKPIAGVKFEILDSNKKVVDTIVTNAEGKATSKDLVYGEYTYREVEVPNDIVLDKTEFPFTIVEDEKVIVREIVNTKIKGSLQILKVDNVTREPIAGVKFQILDSNKNVIETIETNEKGIATSSILVKGKYFYKEVEAKDGYILDETSHKFEIEDNEVVIERTVENTKVLGNLKIIKTEDFFKKPLAGVKFEILNAEKEVVDTIVTNEKGIAVSKKLPQGKYTYKEVEVPEDIVLDSTEYPFEIVEHNKEIVKEIVNTKIKGILEVLKLDKDTKKPIAGVEFKVMDENGNVVETIITNNEGIARSSKLLKGKYTFVETKEAAGYVLEDTVYKFTISKNNDVAKQTIFNSKKTLPVTGNKMGTNTAIFTVIATLTIAAYIAMKKVL